MKVVLEPTMIALVALLAIAIGMPLYALPATLLLPRGQRPGVKKLTISQAALRLRQSGTEGWLLVEAARALVAQ